jgi:hypothetical protein
MSCRNTHAEPNTSAHALAMPASARSASHASGYSVTPMPAVSNAMAASEPRTMAADRTRIQMADSAPMKYPT